MFDEAFDASGSSVVTMSRASVVREHVAYPAKGRHAVPIPVRLQLALRAARDRTGLAPSDMARAAVLVAAGAPARPCADEARGHLPVRPKIDVHLSREERAAVDAARHGRDLFAWLREAIGAWVGWHGRWTSCADAFLRMSFRRLDAAEVARALPGRSVETTYARAQHLGLCVDLGAYEDRMSLHAAAEHAGYHWRTLLRALHAVGVAPKRLPGSKGDASRRFVFVLRRDVDRAVAAWGERESLLAAAERLRCDASELAAHLRARGHAPTNGKCWHLLPKVYDDVVAEWRRGEGPKLGPGQGVRPCAACGASHRQSEPCVAREAA